MMIDPAYAADSRFTYPKQFTMSAKGVNVQNGRFNHSAVDLSLGPFSLKRSWGDEPLYPRVRTFGTGYFSNRIYTAWGHNYVQGSYADTQDSLGNLIVFVVDGQEFRFRVDPNFQLLPQNKSSQGNRLSYVSGSWILVDRGGNVFTFQPHAALPQVGFSYNVNQVLASAVYADGSRLDYAYNGSAQVRTVTSNKGYALVFDYDGQNNLAAACGYNLSITVVNLSTNCAPAVRKVTYGYNAAGTLLTSVTDVHSGVVNISYVSLGNAAWPWPSCITLRNSSTCEISNHYGAPTNLNGGVYFGEVDQVTRQTTATGDVWSYDYVGDEDPQDLPIVAGRPRWTDAFMGGAGGNAVMRYDRGQLVDYNGPLGTFVYRYAFANFMLPTTGTFAIATIDYRSSLPTLITSGAGDVEFFEHNFRGEVTRRITLPRFTDINTLTRTNGGPLMPTDPELALCCVNVGQLNVPAGSTVVTQSFLPDWGGVGLYGTFYAMGCGAGPVDDKRCSKPIAQVDANGRQTDFEYSAIHGGILTETGPAPQPGAPRPQTRYSYVQRHAWTLDAGGAFVRSVHPIWVLASKSICRTSSWTGSACAVPGDEVVTTYEYGPDAGPNNLLLRGEVQDATGSPLRTCYSYDAFGLRTGVTSPRAGLAVCP